jgi:hypothetical protein
MSECNEVTGLSALMAIYAWIAFKVVHPSKDPVKTHLKQTCVRLKSGLTLNKSSKETAINILLHKFNKAGFVETSKNIDTKNL